MLITTDVSARGLDIPDIDLVVNYDMPDKPENYVHRCGRTGRGKKKGVAIGFCSTEEQSVIEDIEQYMGKRLDVLEVSRSEYMNVVDSSVDLTVGWKKLMSDNPDLDSFDKVTGKKNAKKKRRK